MADGFIFYKSFYEALNEVDDPAAKLAAVEAILKYGIEHEESELSGVAKIIYMMAKPQIDANSKRKNNGEKGGRPTEKTDGFENEKPMVSENDNQWLKNKKPKEKEKEKDKEKDKENEKVKGSRFTPPTVAEVQDYCRERGNSVNAERFVAFYAAKGWMIGANKMKDWKQAVITWEQKDKEKARSGTMNVFDAWDNA